MLWRWSFGDQCSVISDGCNWTPEMRGRAIPLQLFFSFLLLFFFVGAIRKRGSLMPTGTSAFPDRQDAGFPYRRKT